MAFPPQELDYTTIDRPYDASLNRVVSEAQKLGSPSLLEGAGINQSSNGSGDGGTINTDNKTPLAGNEYTDVWLSSWIKSKNYLPKTMGFFLDAMNGYIECMNVFISGDVTATTGSIGGFVIGADYLRDAANAFGLASTVTSADDVRFWAGSTFANRDSALFKVTEAGVLTAQSGTIGGWTIGATTLSATGIILNAGNQKITVGSIDPSIIVDGINKNIRTSAYSSGTEGWRITKDGDAEFNQITARGEFHTSVLSYGSVHVTAGSSLLAFSGGTLKNDIFTIDNAASAALETGITDIILLETGDEMLIEDSVTLDVNDPPTGHIQTFSVSDILRIKDGSGNDNWFTVASVVNNTTYYSYVCTKASGSNVTFYAGAAVADYGPSGQGLIFSTVDSVNAPYISVQTHAGSPWSAITERLRMGNLNGYMDYATSIYGFAVGSSSGTNANITIDPTNGIRIRNGTTNVMSIDNAGNATFSGSITATSGSIGGWTIGAASITDTAATTGMSSAVTAGDDIRFWAGHVTPGSAPFRVTEAGVLVASSATISGSITATTGTIGGFSIGATTIEASNLTLTSGAAGTANITVGTGSTAAGLNSPSASGDIAFWAGSTFANKSGAPFTVTAGGALIATSATINGSPILNQDIFGDGSDGAATYSGAGTTTLTSDKFYTNLSLDTSRVFVPNGFAVFVNGTLTIGSSAYISADGNSSNNGGDASGGGPGSGGTAGAALSSNRYFGSLAGTAGGAGGSGGTGAGGVGTVGSNGTATTSSLNTTNQASNGATGGTGGSGGSAGGVGGSGGTAGVLTSSSNIKPRNVVDAIQMLDHDTTPTLTFIKGGPSSGGSGGGGAGGGNGGGTTGGGGGGGGAAGGNGGTIVICARKISISTSSYAIRALGGNGGNGGAGGNGTGSGSSGGGGGGGGNGGQGGNIIVIYSQDVAGTLSSKVGQYGGNPGSVGAGGSSGGGVGSGGAAGSGGQYGGDGIKILLQV